MGRLDCVYDVRSYEKDLIQTIWILENCAETENNESKIYGKPKCQMKTILQTKAVVCPHPHSS
jgi:hypothetical protein